MTLVILNTFTKQFVSCVNPCVCCVNPCVCCAHCRFLVERLNFPILQTNLFKSVVSTLYFSYRSIDLLLVAMVNFCDDAPSNYTP